MFQTIYLFIYYSSQLHISIYLLYLSLMLFYAKRSIQLTFVQANELTTRCHYIFSYRNDSMDLPFVVSRHPSLATPPQPTLHSNLFRTTERKGENIRPALEMSGYVEILLNRKWLAEKATTYSNCSMKHAHVPQEFPRLGKFLLLDVAILA